MFALTTQSVVSVFVCKTCHDGSTQHNGRHIVMINVSPIERGHVLLVPQLDHCLPQVHTQTDGRTHRHTDTQTDRHIVMINVSPIERGHVLLVPQLDHCLPQVHTQTHRHTDRQTHCNDQR